MVEVMVRVVVVVVRLTRGAGRIRGRERGKSGERWRRGRKKKKRRWKRVERGEGILRCFVDVDAVDAVGVVGAEQQREVDHLLAAH